jgi:hypothetical protein
LTNHLVTPGGIAHVQPMPYLDTQIEQNGIMYVGRLYPVNPHEVPLCRRVEIACRQSGKMLGRGDAASLYYYCKAQACKTLHRVSITDYLRWYTEGKGVFRIEGTEP